MNVSWSARALKAVNQTSDYILDTFGFTANESFLESIQQASDLLLSNPMAGQIEPLLTHTPIQYRSIVIHRLGKIVYYIKKDTIRIAAFWDTGREPKRLMKETQKKETTGLG